MTDNAKTFVANWKMNGSLELCRRYVQLGSAFPQNLRDFFRHHLVVCPPSPYLGHFDPKTLPFSLGAQDCAATPPGAHTGDVGSEMLRELGCTYVLLGHAERRIQHGEDGALIAKKWHRARGNGLTPILCIGEDLETKKSGKTLAHLRDQLSLLRLERIPCLAYEPLWAIGSGKSVSTEDLKPISSWLRGSFPKTKIFYGGSVRGPKEVEYLDPYVDGFLVGGLSLSPEQLFSLARPRDAVAA